MMINMWPPGSWLIHTVMASVLMHMICAEGNNTNATPSTKYDKGAIDASLKKTAEEQVASNKLQESVLTAALDKLPSTASSNLKKVEISVAGNKGMSKGAGVFQPAGYNIAEEMEYDDKTKNNDADIGASTNPYSSGFMGPALMNGCFGRNYKPADPCYDYFSANPSICKDLLEGSMSIGVGFDVSETYTVESRRRGLMTQNCAEHRGFQDKDVPDNMLADPILEYKVFTTTFESLRAYQHELASQAGVAVTDSTFAKGMESVSAGVSGGFGPISVGVKTSFGKGHSSSRAQSNSDFTGSSSAGSEQKRVYIAVLEADLLMYEIYQDSVKPDDLRSEFLQDFLSLPESFHSPGGFYKYNDFIMRWGTHYIKYAKFGGQLKMIKTKEATESESFSTFTQRSENEFQRAMATMSSASVQASVNTPWVNVEAGYSKSNSQGSSQGQANSQGMDELSSSYKQDAYGSTLFEVEGGDPEIAASIFDAYTPSFKNDFEEWLKSVPNHPKPFNFKLGDISELLNINFRSLMGGNCSTCNSNKDCSIPVNKTSETFQCNDLEAKQTALGNRRMSLKRAIEVYLKEGAISTDDSHITGGNIDCEHNNLDVRSKQKMFPSIEDIQLRFHIVRIVFAMPKDITGKIRANDVVQVVLRNGRWFTVTEDLVTQNGDVGFAHDKRENKVIVRGLVLTYNEKTGQLNLDTADVTTSKENMGEVNLTGFSDMVLAHAEYTDPVAAITRNRQIDGFASVPCNYHWTNTRRFDSFGPGDCVLFSATSTGPIYVILAAAISETDTWYNVRISPRSVALYKGLQMKDITIKNGAISQGDAILYQLYFVCVHETSSRTHILYGTAAEKDSTSLQTWMDYTYEQTDEGSSSGLKYYTFGAGEDTVEILDVALVPQKDLHFTCRGDYVRNETTGNCQKECDATCDPASSCTKANDPSSCARCRDKYTMITGKKVCVTECPDGTTLSGKLCEGVCHELCDPEASCTKHNDPSFCDKCRDTYVTSIDGRKICVTECGHNYVLSGMECKRVTDCSEMPSVTGVRHIDMAEPDGKSFEQSTLTVYCDKGWTVIMRRKDGSVDFARKWDDYKRGFGYIGGEFWLGNDHIHTLTTKRQMALRVDVQEYSGRREHAMYDIFSVGPESDNYRLKASNYNEDSSAGRAANVLEYHNGQMFSTTDRDNDSDPSGHCARKDGLGGWWYKGGSNNNCFLSQLTGLYGASVGDSKGIVWTNFATGCRSACFRKTATMAVRPM